MHAPYDILINSFIYTTLNVKGYVMRKHIYIYSLLLLSFAQSQAGFFTAVGAYVGIKANYFISDMRERVQPVAQGAPVSTPQQRLADIQVRDMKRETLARAAAVAALVTPLP